MSRGSLGVALLVACLVLAGCGSGHRSSPHAVRPGQAPRVPYTWRLAANRPAPSVSAENSHPGTSAWRLPGPPSDVGGLARGGVSGYVAAEAVSPGQIETIYASAPGSARIQIRIFRMGWYGGRGGREVLDSVPLATVRQPQCPHDFETGLTECRWHPTLSFRVPPALPSGVYIVRLSASTGESDCLFVVRAAHPEPLLAELPTSTYEAYNAWGGDSLYPGGQDRVGITGTTQGVEVSYDRPYDSVTGAGQFFARDVAMVHFLERYGYPVSYTTSESVDADPGQLRGVRAVIDFGHSEYWSARQARAFATARDRGTALLFLSSDTLAWRIRYAAHGQVIVGFKEHAALDPDRADPTGPFPGGGASLAGSAYLGCIAPRLSQPGPPTYRYYAWHAAPGLKPSWLFAHTGIDGTTAIPGIVGYELDMPTSLTPPGTQLIGYGAAPCMPAAPGEPQPGPGQNLAETTLYTARSGAIVFSSGTLGWELGLAPVPSASPDAPRAPDPRLVEMTRNLLGHVLSAPAGAR